MKRSTMLRAGVVACVSASMTFMGLPANAAPGHEVIATGLDNPRGLAIANDGSIYVAESGSGGSVLAEGLNEGEPGYVCMGNTGAVTKISKGKQTRIAKFASATSAAEDEQGNPTCEGTDGTGTGPSAVAVNGLGNLTVVMGLGGDDQSRAVMEASGYTGFGRMYEVAPNGKTRLLADITAHEVKHNPDGAQVDSNPYGVTILSNGDRIVADAGGNSIVRYHANGTTSTVAAFGLLDPKPFAPSCANELPPEVLDQLPPVGTPIPAEAVPTSVAQGPDGAIYVGTLSGFPFAEKNARIYRIDPKTGAVTPYGPNLTLVVGIAFAPDGTLYATQISNNGDGFFCPDIAPGALVKVTKTSATVVTELPLPGGIAIDKSGNAYVSVLSVVRGMGQVWKIKL